MSRIGSNSEDDEDETFSGAEKGFSMEHFSKTEPASTQQFTDAGQVQGQDETLSEVFEAAEEIHMCTGADIVPILRSPQASPCPSPAVLPRRDEEVRAEDTTTKQRRRRPHRHRRGNTAAGSEFPSPRCYAEDCISELRRISTLAEEKQQQSQKKEARAFKQRERRRRRLIDDVAKRTRDEERRHTQAIHRTIKSMDLSPTVDNCASNGTGRMTATCTTLQGLNDTPENIALSGIADALTWRHSLEMSTEHPRSAKRVVVHPDFLSKALLVFATGNRRWLYVDTRHED
jgi:hypothetical protein